MRGKMGGIGKMATLWNSKEKKEEDLYRESGKIW